MMSEKAELFGDKLAFIDALWPRLTPVCPFDHEEWEQRREGIVLTGTHT